MKTPTDIGKELHDKVASACKIIAENRSVKNRFKLLNEAGYSIHQRKLGTGQTGSFKIVNDEIRIKAAASWGRYNYGYAVIINL